MDLTQDVLLPILIATIIANTAIVAILLASGRIGRRRRMATAGGHASGSDQSLASASVADRSATTAWPADATMSDTPAAPPIDPLVVEPEAPLAGPPDEPVGVAVAATAPPVVEPPTLPDDTDPLTGLPDATAFSRLVAEEDARLARYHHPATVVIFELDGLERLVDRLGTDAGDRVVPAVADSIRRLARSADHVARLGPGRFAALLPETDEITAINYIERVRRACDLWLESGAMALRLAIGWAGSAGDPPLPDAQRLATDRMYAEVRRNARREAVEAEAVEAQA